MDLSISWGVDIFVMGFFGVIIKIICAMHEIDLVAPLWQTRMHKFSWQKTFKTIYIGAKSEEQGHLNHHQDNVGRYPSIISKLENCDKI